MKVIVTNSYDESCAVVAGMIRDLVNAKPNAKLGLATGGTPVPIYQKLAQMNKAGEVDFSAVHTVNLDEYCGLPGCECHKAAPAKAFSSFTPCSPRRRPALCQ